MDEQMQKIEEFREAFRHLTQDKGWRLHQWGVTHDDEGFFVAVTLKWEKPSEAQKPF